MIIVKGIITYYKMNGLIYHWLWDRKNNLTPPTYLNERSSLKLLSISLYLRISELVWYIKPWGVSWKL